MPNEAKNTSDRPDGVGMRSTLRLGVGLIALTLLLVAGYSGATGVQTRQVASEFAGLILLVLVQPGMLITFQLVRWRATAGTDGRGTFQEVALTATIALASLMALSGAIPAGILWWVAHS